MPITANALQMDSFVFDCHTLMRTFYRDHVRLGKTRRDELGGYRDANLARLTAGLEKLGPIKGSSRAAFEWSMAQGSYKIHTLNQHRDNDYDIDTGVVFRAENLPDDPKEARRRVAQALREAGGNFRRPPEARTNAVTVWYAEGYHVDLAIYRINGSRMEHAGGDTWTEVDPDAFPEWFKERNTLLSPASLSDQFRRVVRWLKAFARSRGKWNMPGGMILTALAAETFVANAARDDVALLDTLEALSNRLAMSIQVINPVGGVLTRTQKYIDQVRFLRDKLAWLLPKLAVLREESCTEDDAKRAWRWMFNHSFWETAAGRKLTALADRSAEPDALCVRAHIASSRNGSAQCEYHDGTKLPKGLWIRFAAEDVSLGPNHEIVWIIENTGAEAAANDDLGHQYTTATPIAWECTAYTGTHRMICEVRRFGQVIARGIRSISIG